MRSLIWDIVHGLPSRLLNMCSIQVLRQDQIWTRKSKMLDINFSQQNRAVQQMHFEIKNCWVGKSSEKWDWFLFILSNLLVISNIYLILPFIMMWYWIIWLFCSYFCTWGRWKASRWWDVFFHLQKACKFLFLWSFTFFYLKHEKGCNALRGCFETLSEKEQFRRIGKTIRNEKMSNRDQTKTFIFQKKCFFKKHTVALQVKSDIHADLFYPSVDRFHLLLIFHCKWLPVIRNQNMK